MTVIVCSGGADIVFALDSSRSIGMVNFQRITDFIVTIVQSLDTDSSSDGPTVSRVAVLSYSLDTTVHFYLNSFQKKTDLLQAINVPYDGQPNTNLAEAIRLVGRVTEQSGSRQNGTTKCYEQNGIGQNGMDTMVLDKMVWTQWYGHNGMDNRI